MFLVQSELKHKQKRFHKDYKSTITLTKNLVFIVETNITVKFECMKNGKIKLKFLNKNKIKLRYRYI